MEMPLFVAEELACSLARRIAIHELAKQQLEEAMKSPNVSVRKYDDMQHEFARLDKETKAIAPVFQHLKRTIAKAPVHE